MDEVVVWLALSIIVVVIFFIVFVIHDHADRPRCLKAADVERRGHGRRVLGEVAGERGIRTVLRRAGQ